MVPLTEIVSVPDTKRAPLMVEIPLPPGLDGPYLVTSTRGVLWVERRLPTGCLRVGVRKAPLDFLFRDLLLKFLPMAEEREWGNVHPCTALGVADALAHLAEYEISPVTVLWGEGFDTALIPTKVQGEEVAWIPQGWAVVVPADRSFLGSAFNFGNGQWGAVLHNPSRGIAVLKPEQQLAAQPDVSDEPPPVTEAAEPTAR